MSPLGPGWRTVGPGAVERIEPEAPALAALRAQVQALEDRVARLEALLLLVGGPKEE